MPTFNIQSKNNKDFSYKWLSALSGFMPLTKKELLILTSFLTIYLEEGDRDLFKTYNRQRVKKDLNITTHNINNYINALKNKRAIYIDNDKSGITQILIPQINTTEDGKQMVDIKINIIV